MKRKRPRQRPAAPANKQPAAKESRVLTMEKPIYGGAFLARDEGKAVFVPLALPGETASVRMVEEKRGYASGEIEHIVAPSPQRVAPRCPHFGPCGGCHYQQASYETQLEWKQYILRETLERSGVQAPAEIAVIAGQPWEYRNRIRLAFDHGGNPGYRGRRSHAVVPITECPIAAPLLVRAAIASAVVLRLAGISRATEMALFCNAEETSLLISIILEKQAAIRSNELALAIREKVPALAGLDIVLESRDGRSPQLIGQWGEKSLFYRAAGIDYRVDRGAFFQVNRYLVDALVERVTLERRGRLAWDLFAGVGLFARQLTQHFEQVSAVESAPNSIAALTENLKGTTGTAVRATTLEFLQHQGHGARPDLIVVDPPRTGLGPEIGSQLAEIAAPALTYVSCDPATLSRDLRQLQTAGYQIESMALADLFPQTFHLETVVRLRRS